MPSFSFRRMRNPVSTTKAIAPKDKDPMTFVLGAVNSNTMFLAEAWHLAQDARDAMQRYFDIGVSRIQGWEGITDEQGEAVEFNRNNLGLWLDMMEAVPYVMEIARITVEEDLPQEDLPAVGEKSPEGSGTSLPTSSKSRKPLPASPESTDTP